MRRQVPKDHRGFARQMRNEPTGAEARLWSILRGRKLAGLRFRRQHPVSGYIVDFICLDAMLIVEAEGSQHAENAGDQRRDTVLASLGYRVIRFWNREIHENPDGVAQRMLFDAGKL